jgi:mannose-6-phosphate isomerase-like protein (cupin superfamily)
MGGFTIKNFNDVPDRTGDMEGLEARWAREHIDSEHLGVSLFRYSPGFHSQLGHRHRVQEEVYVVVSGSGRAKLDDEIVELKPYDALRVAPDVTRAFEAGPEGLELLVFGSGDGGLADAEVEPGWWADAD